MKKSTRVLISIAVLLCFIGSFAVINGWLSLLAKDTHPPCEQLPTVNETTKALAQFEDFAKEIESLGEGITVEVGKPCSDDKERGLILVTYDKRSERDAIRQSIAQRDGFGVPIHLVKR